MNRHSFFGGPVPVLVGVLVVGVAVAALSASQPVLAASSGECVTAHMDVPFRLPDGRLYPAGVLTLCDGGSYSPVDTFQRIVVGGSTVGLFVSNRHRAETRSMEAPLVLFNRDAGGNLSLIGYTLPSSGRSVAFRLKSQDELWQAGNRRRPEGGSTAPVAAIIATAGPR